MYLEKINSPADVKKLSSDEMRALAAEMRTALIKKLSIHGGHCGPNLGMAEAVIALHYVFDSPADKMVFDVSHQSYCHKMLTGRKEAFLDESKYDDVTGYSCQHESPHDHFTIGHTSTSVSLACGLAIGRDLNGGKGNVIAIIGDGSLSGGEALEGLDFASELGSNLIIVVNDNGMSISKSTGALARYLAHIRSTRKYYCAKEHVKSVVSAVPLVGDKLEKTLRTAKGLIKDAIYDSSNMFENFGFQYIGPVNGHDLEDMIEAFSVAKLMRKPCVVHVFTTKGKGWRPAEDNPGEYHAVSRKAESSGKPTFSEAFGRELESLGKSDSRICGITAAMKYATGMNYFCNSCGERYFDVGIAEQHAVTFAAGLAVEGMLPVFAVYSTFLQRGFDQVVHDCAIERTHVVLAIDRAGFTGEDGETHQGIFDVPMLSMIPNTTVYSPASLEEMRLCLSQALFRTEGVAAVRYPKGSEPAARVQPDVELEYSGRHGNTLAVSYGRLSAEVACAAREASVKGAPVDWLRLVRIAPLPGSALDMALDYGRVVFFEEGVLRGGVAEQFGTALLERGFRGEYETVGVDGRFVPAGTVQQQLEMFGLDRESLIRKLGRNNAT